MAAHTSRDEDRGIVVLFFLLRERCCGGQEGGSNNKAAREDDDDALQQATSLERLRGPGTPTPAKGSCEDGGGR